MLFCLLWYSAQASLALTRAPANRICIPRTRTTTKTAHTESPHAPKNATRQKPGAQTFKKKFKNGWTKAAAATRCPNQSSETWKNTATRFSNPACTCTTPCARKTMGGLGFRLPPRDQPGTCECDFQSAPTFPTRRHRRARACTAPRAALATRTFAFTWTKADVPKKNATGATRQHNTTWKNNFYKKTIFLHPFAFYSSCFGRDRILGILLLLLSLR